MSRPLHGTVHGRTIQLDEDPGVAEGQTVEVEITIVSPLSSWGDGIRRSAGGWEHSPEIDAVMERIQQERKMERRSEADN